MWSVEWSEGLTRCGYLLSAYNGHQPGDPSKGARLIIDLVRGEGPAAGKKVPSVFSLGSDAYTLTRAASEHKIKVLDEWKEVSISTDFD